MSRLFLGLLLLALVSIAKSQEVEINDNIFVINNNQIWFNGINTPWHNFSDFGRPDFNKKWWEDEFTRYKENNINLARVWIHCSGDVNPLIDATGKVNGTNDLFWEHMDHLFTVSRENEVYILPALFSFDITKNTYSTHKKWRLWIQSKENIQSYIDNVLITLLQRYDDEPYLLAWEICNEPEWMFENDENGPQSFEDVQTMHAMIAAAIHKHSKKMVTTGSAAPKWNSSIYSSWGDNAGNIFSNTALNEAIDDTSAYLDFYQYHWYPWQTEWMDSPFTKTTAQYQVDDRPVIVGEAEGNAVCDAFLCQTVSEMYENAYLNGFDGVCAWKTPGNDGYGTFENIVVATNSFYNNHPDLVYPDTVTTTYINELAKTNQFQLNIYPNPFKTITNISFQLKEPGNVRFEIVDQLGNHIYLQDKKFHTTGNHSFVFEGSGLAPGIYSYFIAINHKKEWRKMVIIQ